MQGPAALALLQFPFTLLINRATQAPLFIPSPQTVRLSPILLLLFLSKQNAFQPLSLPPEKSGR